MIGLSFGLLPHPNSNLAAELIGTGVHSLNEYFTCSQISQSGIAARYQKKMSTNEAMNGACISTKELKMGFNI